MVVVPQGGSGGTRVALAAAAVTLHVQQWWQSRCWCHDGGSFATGTMLVGPWGGSSGTAGTASHGTGHGHNNTAHVAAIRVLAQGGWQC